MNILVLGCNGMAGFTISKFLTDAGYRVTGFAREQSELVPTIIGDAFDCKLLLEIIQKNNYDYIINTIGLLNENANSNIDKAIYINSYLPNFISTIIAPLNTSLIHLSTDCVFSGEKGRYTETDFPDGKSIYDRSKALGEIIDNRNTTLRTSIIGPDIKENGIGLFNWFMKQEEPIYGYTNAIWSGITTLELSKIIEAVMQQKVAGLMQVVPSHFINKYELLALLNLFFKNGSLIINKKDNIHIDKSLIRTNFDLNYTVPSYEEMIQDLKVWTIENRAFFPHYHLK